MTIQDRQSRITMKRKRPKWGNMTRVLIGCTFLSSLPCFVVGFDLLVPGWNDTRSVPLPPETDVTPVPTNFPSVSAPTLRPTPSPTRAPTPSPTRAPTLAPTAKPTPVPTSALTPGPAFSPAPVPTNAPTSGPSPNPTPMPTSAPTVATITAQPTPGPTSAPTPNPTPIPSVAPTPAPIIVTPQPTSNPTAQPTSVITSAPTPFPTTIMPAVSPSPAPMSSQPVALQPTLGPTINSTLRPTPQATEDPATPLPTFDSLEPGEPTSIPPADTMSPTKPTGTLSPTPGSSFGPKPPSPSSSPDTLTIPLEPFNLTLTFQSRRRRLYVREERRRVQLSDRQLEEIASDLEVPLGDYLLEAMRGADYGEGVALLDVILSVEPDLTSGTSRAKTRDNIFSNGRRLQDGSSQGTFLVEGDSIFGVGEGSEVNMEQLQQSAASAQRSAVQNQEAMLAYLQANSDPASPLQSVSSAETSIDGPSDSGDSGPSLAAIIVGFALVAVAAAGVIGYGYIFSKKYLKKRARRKREREQGVYDPRKSSTAASVAPTSMTSSQKERALEPSRSILPQSSAKVAAMTAPTRDEDEDSSAGSSYEGIESITSEAESDQFARELKLAASLDRRAWEDYEKKRQMFEEEEGQSQYPPQYGLDGGVALYKARKDEEGIEVVEGNGKRGISPEGARSVRSFPYGDEDDSEASDVFSNVDEEMEWTAVGMASALDEVNKQRRGREAPEDDDEYDPTVELMQSLAAIQHDHPPPSKDRAMLLRSSPVSEAPSSQAVKMSQNSSQAVDRDSISQNDSATTGQESRSLQTVDMIREVHKLALFVKRYERKRERKSLDQELEKRNTPENERGLDVPAGPDVSYDALSDSASALRKVPPAEETSKLPRKLETGAKAKPEADRVSSWSTESNSGFLERESELFFTGKDSASARPPPPVRESSNPLKAAKALLKRFQNDERFHPEKSPLPDEVPPQQSGESAVTATSADPQQSQRQAIGAPIPAGQQQRSGTYDSFAATLSPQPREISRPVSAVRGVTSPTRVLSETSSGYQSTDVIDNTSKAVLSRAAGEMSRQDETQTSQTANASRSAARLPTKPIGGRSEVQQKARDNFAAKYGLFGSGPVDARPQEKAQKEEKEVAPANFRQESKTEGWLQSPPDPVESSKQESHKARDEFVGQYGLQTSKPSAKARSDSGAEEIEGSAPRNQFMKKYGLKTTPSPVESQPPQESIEVSHVEKDKSEKFAKRNTFMQKYGLSKAKDKSPKPVEISHHVEQQESPEEKKSSQAREAFMDNYGVQTLQSRSSEDTEELQSEAQSVESRLGITPFSVQKVIASPVLSRPVANKAEAARTKASSPAPEVSRPPTSETKEPKNLSMLYSRGRSGKRESPPVEETPEKIATDQDLNYEISPERVPVADQSPAQRTRDVTRTSATPLKPGLPPKRPSKEDAIDASRRKRSLASLRQNDALADSGSDTVGSPFAPSDESGTQRAKSPATTTPAKPAAQTTAAGKTPTPVATRRTPKSNSKISGILAAFESKPPNAIFPSDQWHNQR